jgi:hypothetical protein
LVAAEEKFIMAYRNFDNAEKAPAPKRNPALVFVMRMLNGFGNIVSPIKENKTPK